MTLAIGDWVHHRPAASVPLEQTIQKPMLITAIDDQGWITCTFEGQVYGEVYKFTENELSKADPEAELAAMKAKSDAVKAAANPPPVEPLTMKHSEVKSGSKK